MCLWISKSCCIVHECAEERYLIRQRSPETCALQYEPVTERASSLPEGFEERRCAAFRNVTTALAFQLLVVVVCVIRRYQSD